MKRITMAAGLAAILFTGAFASSETVRTKTLNLIITAFDEGTDFSVNETSSDDPLQFNVGWLPDGYSLEDHRADNYRVRFKYQKSDNESVTIKYTLSSGTILSVDTENAEVDTVVINGIDAMLIQKEDIVQLVWPVNNKTAFVQVIGEGLTSEEIIRIANDLKY